MMPIDSGTENQDPQQIPFPGLARPLTRQELHVLDLLGQGYTNEDIAHTLEIAVSTVSSHVQHILKKLQVRNRVEAVLYIRHYGAQIQPLRATDTSTPQNRTQSPPRIPLSQHDPLLFLSQINHLNWHIGSHGALTIDYFGIAGMVSLAFYDPSAQRLKIHLTLCGTHTGELNVEVDESLWKYLLEVAEISPNISTPPSPTPRSSTASPETRIDISG